MHDLLQQARAGRPRPLLVTGEPGIGKSSLLDQLIATATGGGFIAVTVRLHDDNAESPLAALYDVVVEVAGQLGHRPSDDVAGAIAELATVAGGRRRAVSPQVVAGLLGRILESWAFRRPVLLVIDDLHSAGPLTGGAVLDLARHVRAHRVLVAVATRPRPDLDAGLADDIDRLVAAGRLEVIELRCFDDADLADLVAAKLGHEPHQDLLDALRERTGGLPFFAAELLDALATTDAIEVVDGRARVPRRSPLVLPRRVATAVLHRVFSLGANARGVATAAAVLGEFGPDRIGLLAELTGSDEAECAAALTLLTDARVLELTGGRFRFAHAMVRAALREDLGPAARRRWHARIASVLGASPDGDVLEIASHLRDGMGGRDAWAVRIFIEAGDLTLHQTPRHAVEWYRQALARLQPHDALVPRVHLKLSTALGLCSEHAEAAHLAALALRNMPPGPERRHGAIVASNASFAAGQLDRAALLLDLALAEPGDDTAILLLHRARLHFGRERLGAATADLDAARALGVGPEAPMADAIEMQLRFSAGDYRRGATDARRLRRSLTASAPAHRRTVQIALCTVAALDLDPADALTYVADVAPDDSMAAWYDAIASYALLRQGRLWEAVQTAEVARQAVVEPTGDQTLATFVPVLIAGRVALGDLAGAEAAVAYAARTPFDGSHAGVQCAEAALRTALRDRPGALALLDEAEQRSTEIGRINTLAMAVAQRVATLTAFGDSVGARQANDRLLALPHHASGVAVTALRLLSTARAERDPDAARAAREHAIAHGLALDAAISLALLGSIEQDGDALTAAYDEATRLGAVLLQRALASRLRGVGRRSPHRRHSERGLSAGEQHICALVTQGLTNRQVAEQMQLSQKTVEVYLSRIYAKTGLRSRVELAVAVRGGVLAPTG